MSSFDVLRTLGNAPFPTTVSPLSPSPKEASLEPVTGFCFQGAWRKRLLCPNPPSTGTGSFGRVRLSKHRCAPRPPPLKRAHPASQHKPKSIGCFRAAAANCILDPPDRHRRRWRRPGPGQSRPAGALRLPREGLGYDSDVPARNRPEHGRASRPSPAPNCPSRLLLQKRSKLAGAPAVHVRGHGRRVIAAAAGLWGRGRSGAPGPCRTVPDDPPRLSACITSRVTGAKLDQIGCLNLTISDGETWPVRMLKLDQFGNSNCAVDQFGRSPLLPLCKTPAPATARACASGPANRPRSPPTVPMARQLIPARAGEDRRRRPRRRPRPGSARLPRLTTVDRAADRLGLTRTDSDRLRWTRMDSNGLGLTHIDSD